MFIVKDKEKLKGSLKLHQQPYLENLVQKFIISNGKSVSMPHPPHFILSKDQCAKSNVDYLKMKNGISSVCHDQYSS